MLEIAGGIVIGFFAIVFILANLNALPKLIVAVGLVVGFFALLMADVYLMEALLGKYKAFGILGSIAFGYGAYYYIQHKKVKEVEEALKKENSNE
jgi:membrane-bound ClpP family serine protease